MIALRVGGLACDIFAAIHPYGIEASRDSTIITECLETTLLMLVDKGLHSNLPIS